MAWQVFDFMHPEGSGKTSGLAGPLPRKRWVKQPTDKRHKLGYRFKYSRTAGTETADEMNERHAIEYARWLARRDGIEIPPGTVARADWSGVTDAAGKWRRRVEAVEFGRVREEWKIVGTGRSRRGETTKHWACASRIEIPSWDWQPAEPVEEILPLDPVRDPAPVVAPTFRVPARLLATTAFNCVLPSRRPVAPSCVIRLAA